jgi:hypothetical protein
MKPGPTFKLKKEAKRQLCFINDPHQRGVIKNMFIQAQMSEEQSKTKQFFKNKEVIE